MVTIQLNGEPLNVPVNCTVSQMLDLAEFGSKLVAVEVNQEVIPRTQQASHVLRAQDQVEVVTLVGGG